MVIQSSRWRKSACILSALAFFLLCINAALLSWLGGYDVRLGNMHISAHGLFKPLLMLNGSFILMLMAWGRLGRSLCPRDDVPSMSLRDWAWIGSAIVALVSSLYLSSALININHPDWTHRHISSGIHSLSDAWQLFIGKQADGFCRPLTFVSLWVDYRMFGSWYPGYHIQSIVLHILNSLLVVTLAGTMRFGRIPSMWAGLLFAATSVGFEPVLWPAARFDLLAAAFTLAAFIFAIRYFRDPALWTWELVLSNGFYAAGILSKESSYALPFLVLAVVGFYPVWSLLRPRFFKWLAYFACSTVISALAVCARIAIYGNLGGYSGTTNWASPHFVPGFRTIGSLLRVLPLSILGVNTTAFAPRWATIGLILFIIFLVVAALICRGNFQLQEYLLAGWTLIAAIPVMNIVSWIGSSMQHSRYLYLPAVFAALMMASVLNRGRFSSLLLTGYLLLSAAGVLTNIQGYKRALARTEIIAESVRMEWLRNPEARRICIVGLPEHVDGVFYFGSELIERVKGKVPRAEIVRVESNQVGTEPKSTSIYRWSPAKHDLVRIGS